MSAPQILAREIQKVTGSHAELARDHVALEEPLEIQVAHGPVATREWKTVAITMRTPGHDRELATGFLVGEGLLRSLDQVEAVHSRGPRYGEGGWQHSVRVTLKPGVVLDMARLERNFYTTSSCGVCGKTSMEALELSSFPPLPAADWHIAAEIIRDLPDPPAPGPVALRADRRRARGRPVHPRGPAHPRAGGRRPPQRGGQGHRRPVPGGPKPVVRTPCSSSAAAPASS